MEFARTSLRNRKGCSGAHLLLQVRTRVLNPSGAGIQGSDLNPKTRSSKRLDLRNLMLSEDHSNGHSYRDSGHCLLESSFCVARLTYEVHCVGRRKGSTTDDHAGVVRPDL